MKGLTNEQVEAINNLMHDFRYEFEGSRDTDSIEEWIDGWVNENKIIKTDYETLKDICKKQGSALTASFKENGDILIYVSPNAELEEVTKSMTQMIIEIAKHRGEQ